MCICSNSKNAWEYSTASLSICLVQNFIVYNFVPIQNYNNGSIAFFDEIQNANVNLLISAHCSQANKHRSK